MYRDKTKRRAKFYISFEELATLLHLPKYTEIIGIETSYEDMTFRRRMLLYVGHASLPEAGTGETLTIESPVGKLEFDVEKKKR